MKNTLFIFVLFLVFSCSEPSKEKIVNSTNVQAPKGMSYIPEGTFTMGGKSDQADKDEFPRHEVSLSSFFMDQTEVTNQEYASFVEATGYVTVAERDVNWEELKLEVPVGTPKPADSLLLAGSLVFNATEGPVDLRDYSQWWTWTTGANWGHPDGAKSMIHDRMKHPVVHIAWEDANAYCAWAEKRLPTEAEWEWAAMGGLDDSKYPWGNEPVEKAYDKANFWQGFFPYQNEKKDGFYGTAPVKSFSANGYGLYDMAGNVWEWCQDKYDADTYRMELREENPSGPTKSYDPFEPYTEKYVMRGGSFLCNDSYCSGYRVSRRMRSSKDSGFNHTGFRCVKDAERGIFRTFMM